MHARHPTPYLLTRRRMLAGLGIGVGVVALGACGDDDAADTTDGTPQPGPGRGADGDGDGDGEVGGPEIAMAQFFGGPLFAAGDDNRAPFGLVDRDGLLPASATPGRLEVQLADAEGTALGAPVTVERHDDGLPRGYYPLPFRVDEPGFYTARTVVDGVSAEMSFQVHPDDELVLIRPGQELPAFDTPTVDDARGVDPTCTREPTCPLHDVTLAQALAEARPVALLVATPAFCQIAICGPVLDVLLDVTEGYPEVRFLHAEVFADPYTDTNVQAPVVQELGLHFEPTLILSGADGVVTERLDVIYDRVELASSLDRLVGRT